jgi:hypothetical protein
LFALGVAISACADNGPEVSVKDFMAQEVQPTAEIYWNSVQYISDEQGEHEIFPRTDGEWEEVRQGAERLAEIGAMLKQPEYADGRGPAWIDFADGLIEVAGQAEQAAVDQDVDAVFEVGGTVYSVCSACHQAYPAKTADAGADEAG